MLWFLSSSWNSLMSQQLGHITQLYSWSIFRYFHTGNSVAILSQLPACLPEKNHRSCCSYTIVVEYRIFNEAGKRTGGVSADGCLHRILFNFFAFKFDLAPSILNSCCRLGDKQRRATDGRSCHSHSVPWHVFSCSNNLKDLLFYTLLLYTLATRWKLKVRRRVVKNIIKVRG